MRRLPREMLERRRLGHPAFERPRLHRKAAAAILGDRAEPCAFSAQSEFAARFYTALLRARHVAHGVALGAPAVERGGGLAGGGHALRA